MISPDHSEDRGHLADILKFTSFLKAHFAVDITERRLVKFNTSDTDAVCVGHAWILHAASSLWDSTGQRIDPASWKSSDGKGCARRTDMLAEYSNRLSDALIKVKKSARLLTETLGKPRSSLGEDLSSYLRHSGTGIADKVSHLVQCGRTDKAVSIVSQGYSTAASIKSLLLLRRCLLPTISRISKQTRRGFREENSEECTQALQKLDTQRAQLKAELDKLGTEVEPLLLLVKDHDQTLRDLVDKLNLTQRLQRKRLEPLLLTGQGDDLSHYSLGELQSLCQLADCSQQALSDEHVTAAERSESDAGRVVAGCVTASHNAVEAHGSIAQPVAKDSDDDSSGGSILTPTSSQASDPEHSGGPRQLDERDLLDSSTTRPHVSTSATPDVPAEILPAASALISVTESSQLQMKAHTRPWEAVPKSAPGDTQMRGENATATQDATEGSEAQNRDMPSTIRRTRTSGWMGVRLRQPQDPTVPVDDRATCADEDPAAAERCGSDGSLQTPARSGAFKPIYRMPQMIHPPYPALRRTKSDIESRMTLAQEAKKLSEPERD